MQKSKITSALLIALASSAASATDRFDLNAIGSTLQKNVSIEQDVLAKSSSTWLIKAKSSTAISVAQAAKLKSATFDSNESLAKANDGLDQLEAAIYALGVEATVMSRTNKLVAGLVVEANADAINKIAELTSVDSVLPVYNSELNIADSAAYINATQLVDSQVASGSGVTVAILDSGLDYTHAAVGGPGTAEAFSEAIADLADTPAWPIGNVLGGFDFFNGDPDPMDNNNHGTHVAHSVLGVSPDSGIYAYTVCDQSCPGAAQLAGLEAAMDPNGDGDISDRVDIVNMSLGGDYGSNRGGAVAELIDSAVELGVVVAISAGNDGAYPFIVGGPSTTNNALSVGAMTHPTEDITAVAGSVDGVGVKANAAAFNPDEVFSFDNTVEVVYAEADTNANGCAPYTTDLTGVTALIDRGGCAFTTKIQNAQDAGAVFAIVANNVPNAFPLTMGGTPAEPLSINSIMVTYEVGLDMKAGLEAGGFAYSFNAEPFVQTGAIASFTSRGPSLDGRLKPEITAPGVEILTASVGTGTELSPISGTSFSGPMTAGAVGLLAEVFPNRNAFELKATIMNTANLNVTFEPTSLNPGTELAPISYIGSGLVDAEKAAASETAAWDADTLQAALSFGPLTLTESASVTKTVTLKNFSSTEKTYSLSDEARFSDDSATGALSMSYPASVTVGAGQTTTFEVTATFDPTLLPDWTLTSDNVYTESGTFALTSVEFDGVLSFTEDGADEEAMHLVYHSIPMAYAEASLSTEITDDGVVRMVTNTGAATMGTFTSPVTVYSGVDEDLPLDLVAASVETIPTGICEAGAIIFTTLTMRDPVMLTHQAGFFMDVDIDSDGLFDYTVQNLNYGDFGSSTFESVTFTRPFSSLSGSIFFTSHEPGSNQFTMFSCAEDLGLSAETIGAVNATLAFRIEDSRFDFFPNTAYDADLVTSHSFAFDNLPFVTDASGNFIAELAAGETGYLQNVGTESFTFSTTSGFVPSVVPADGGNAPVLENQSFSVDENTAVGTMIGQIVATDADGITSPVSEYFVSSSSSIAVEVSRSGAITVANSDVLDYDAGLTSVELSVVAIDTLGNMSDSATVTIAVNNLLDEASEQPVVEEPTPTPARSSGGSMGWLTTLLLPVIYFRRRLKK